MVNRRSHIAGVLLVLLMVALSPLTATAPAQAASIDLHARMHATSAYPDAHGGAWYEGHHGWREFDIHVRGIRKLAGKTVKVAVHGAFVGRMRVSQYGTAHLHRQTGVPKCSGGTVVRVRTKAGTLVTSGTMRHRHHHMMWN